MNAKNLIIAAAVFAATGSAFAQNTEWVEFNNFVSTKTRAEVQAELAQANTAGNTEYVEFTNVASITPRSVVRAEVAKAQGATVVGSSPEYVEFTNVASTKTRAEVRNEAMHAAKTANLSSGS